MKVQILRNVLYHTRTFMPMYGIVTLLFWYFVLSPRDTSSVVLAYAIFMLSTDQK